MIQTVLAETADKRLERLFRKGGRWNGYRWGATTPLGKRYPYSSERQNTREVRRLQRAGFEDGIRTKEFGTFPWPSKDHT